MSTSKHRVTHFNIFCSFDRIVRTEKLQAHPQNPNRHPPEQIRLFGKILRANGWRRPIVVSRRSGFVTKGHGALLAARAEKLATVPVNYQDYASAEAELEDMVADNELGRLSKMDQGALDKLLGELVRKGRDPELAGILSRLGEDGDGGLPLYPITAQLNEAYDYVLIFTTNDSDFVFLQNLCGVETESSYKKTGIGTGRCVPFKRFLKSLHENRHSINVQVGHDDHAPARPRVRRVRAGKPK